MGLGPLVLTAVLSGYAIQPPGAFHGDEPVARDGEAWLALQVEAGHAALVPTRLQVHEVHDALLDDAGESSGREVGSALGEDGLVFLRGPGLHAGPVRMAPFAPAERLGARPDYGIRFDGRAYRLEVECVPAPDPAPEQQQFACVLVLGSGGDRQRLFELRGYVEPGSDEVITSDDGKARLLFAGDLDRDGRLDLIFDTSDHYNVSRPTLFLSSLARPGELVGEAAQYRSVGC